MKRERNEKIHFPRSIENALQVLETVAEAKQPLSISGLSDLLDAKADYTRRIVAVLLARGYIRRDDDSVGYRLGYKILEINSGMSYETLMRQLVKPHLNNLSLETGETVRLAVKEGEEIYYAEQSEGKNRIRLELKIGFRAPIHCTAAGKAILAFLPEEERDEFISSRIHRAYTSRTITDKARLKTELAKVRTVGYAVTDEEFRDQVTGVGAPIFNFASKPIGSIVIVGPSFRMRPWNMARMGEKIKQAALQISSMMGCPARRAETL